MGGYHQVILPSDTDMIGHEGWDTSNTVTHLSVWEQMLCKCTVCSDVISIVFP